MNSHRKPNLSKRPILSGVNQRKIITLAHDYPDFIVLHLRGFVWFRSEKSATQFLKRIQSDYPQACSIPDHGYDHRHGVDLLGQWSKT